MAKDNFPRAFEHSTAAGNKPPPPRPKQIFSAPKLNTPISPKVARPPAVDGRTKRLRGIVDDNDIVRVTQLDNLFDIGRIAEQMGHDDRASSACTRSFNCFRREIELTTNIGQHRRRAHGQDRRHHGAATKTRNNHFIALVEVTGAQSKLQRQTARAAKYGILDAEEDPVALSAMPRDPCPAPLGRKPDSAVSFAVSRGSRMALRGERGGKNGGDDRSMVHEPALSQSKGSKVQSFSDREV